MVETSLPRISVHGLRHTYATIVLGWGVEVWKVSRILGHSKIQTTLDIYNRYIPARDEDLKGIYRDALSGPV